MSPSRLWRALAAVLLGALLLLVPAIYNGYPLTWWDSSAYIEHAFSLVPRPDRLIGYSLFIRGLAVGHTLWAVAVAQCVLTSALVYGLVRSTSRGDAAVRHLVLIGLLAACTSLPWVAGLIIADVFTPVLVIALYLLSFGHVSHRGARALLALLVAVTVVVHLTHLWIGVSLLGAAFVLSRTRGDVRPWQRLRAPAVALALGLASVLAFNFARTGRVVLAPGGSAFILAHLEESGIASRLLERHCPERDYLLCPHRARLPMHVDAFLWNDKLDLFPFEREDAIRREARRLLRDSLLEEPWLHLKVAARYTFKAFFAFETGMGLDGESADAVASTIQRHFPGDLAAYRAARQQRGVLPIGTLRALHTPVAYALLAAVTVLLALSARRERHWPARESTRLIAFTFVAFVVNAVLCGNLSGINDRYGARVLWLLALGVFVRCCEWRDVREAGYQASHGELAGNPPDPVARSPKIRQD
jgi:hypothetical protein